MIDKNTVKLVRNSLNETQAQFAKRMGVTTVTVGRWETGERQVSSPYALEIMTLFNELSKGDSGAMVPDDFVAHRFLLRHGTFITLHLPSDLTTNEARRLAEFVKSLPIE